MLPYQGHCEEVHSSHQLGEVATSNHRLATMETIARNKNLQLCGGVSEPNSLHYKYSKKLFLLL